MFFGKIFPVLVFGFSLEVVSVFLPYQRYHGKTNAVFHVAISYNLQAVI